MKNLMVALAAGVALAAVAETKDWQVYTFTQTGKALNAETGKVETKKLAGVAVYDKTSAEKLYAFTWGTKKNTKFTSAKNEKLVGKKAFTGEASDIELFSDMVEKGQKVSYGFKCGANVGYGMGSAKSVKGNFVGEKTFGTWQLKLDSGATKKFEKGKFVDINDLLEAKSVEVAE